MSCMASRISTILGHLCFRCGPELGSGVQGRYQILQDVKHDLFAIFMSRTFLMAYSKQSWKAVVVEHLVLDHFG
jgi:hypothetical protein